MNDESDVNKLGKIIGFGNMMHIASDLWAESLKKNIGTDSGAFVVGPCKGGIRKCQCQEDGEPVSCHYCEGSGWLTKAVYDLIKEQPNE